jgi:hypothetical protein
MWHLSWNHKIHYNFIKSQPLALLWFRWLQSAHRYLIRFHVNIRLLSTFRYPRWFFLVTLQTEVCTNVLSSSYHVSFSSYLLNVLLQLTNKNGIQNQKKKNVNIATHVHGNAQTAVVLPGGRSRANSNSTYNVFTIRALSIQQYRWSGVFYFVRFGVK